MATDDLQLRDASAVLDKAADENFPVAPFFLPRAWRDDLMAVYGVVRLIDDIGDSDLAPGAAHARYLGVDGPGAPDDPLPLLDAVEADLGKVFGGAEPGHPLVRALAPAAERGTLTVDPFLGLLEANRQDQRVTRYETYDDLVAYCALSANPIGRLVLAITGTESPERIRRSDAVCTGLQIVEHIQDVAEDLRRGRIYLPVEDMKQFHVSESDLSRPTAGASVRALVAFETERARRLLNEGTPLVGSVHGRLKLLLAGFVAGGRAAARSIVAAGYDVLPGPPRPTKPRMLREAGAVLRGEG
ncbi:squalene synthase HpnC [Streptomyces sp. NPDC046465]|uniref:squalene synthase HpnC n=1 Tax=Streptomyces sp. NPDC046465 TaxID=3155810 RepID=UPI0033FDEB9F